MYVCVSNLFCVQVLSPCSVCGVRHPVMVGPYRNPILQRWSTSDPCSCGRVLIRGLHNLLSPDGKANGIAKVVVEVSDDALSSLDRLDSIFHYHYARTCSASADVRSLLYVRLLYEPRFTSCGLFIAGVSQTAHPSVHFSSFR